MAHPDLACRSLRILVVEDEILTSLFMETLIEDMGWTPLGGVFGLDQALVRIGHDDFDLVLLDINLDGEMSYPAAGMLRDRGIPFIFTSAYAREQLPGQWQDRPLLNKPVASDCLKAEVIRTLADSQTPRQ